VLHGIWLVIKLGRDILPTHIFTKFHDYTMKTIEVIERTNALDAARPTDARVPIIQTYKKYGTSGHVCYRGDSCVEAVWFRKVSLYLPLSQMIIISKQKTHLNSCFVKLIQWYHPTVHTRSIDLLLVH